METALRIRTIRLLVKLEKNPAYINSLDISYSTNKYSNDVDSLGSVSDNLKKKQLNKDVASTKPIKSTSI